MKKQSLKFSKILISIMVSFCLLLSLTGCAGAKGDVGGALGGVFHSGIYENCSKGTSSSSTGEEAETPDEAENIKKIYSVFKGKLQWNDYMIAGMCGNFSVESSIQPKRIEADYCYHPDYDKALEEHDSYCSKVFAAYTANGVPVNYAAFAGSDGNYCGYGLPQWTGPRGEKLLKTAEEIGVKWYEIDIQLAYILYEVQNTRPAYDGEPSSASDAALEFTTKYEGNTTMEIAERQQKAEQICAGLSSNSVDTAYADKIFEYAQKFGETKEGSGSGSSSSSSKKCSAGTKSGGNSSIAEALVSIAYDPNNENATNNTTVTCASNGGSFLATNTYKSIHDQVLSGDGYYASCDRNVATAVRWAGADDNFPAGPTGTQYSYLTSHTDKWECIGDFNESILSELQPGDVVVTKGDGHIWAYAGNEAIKEKFPDSNCDAVGGSFGDFTAQIQTARGYLSDSRGYAVFRNIKPEDNSKYKDISE